ncbi:hypothetical protein HK102_012830 [Quaeritorhiza haematococci]|nr:hypothetical protein HK102_012830 [Quaeritorhiza haematococci]
MFKRNLLSLSIALLTTSIITQSQGISGHGLLFAPIPVNPDTFGTVRGIQKLNYSIDSLRNPVTRSTPVCRGEPVGAVTPITLENGKSHTITMALSIGAQHIGPCAVEILDANNLDAPGVTIATAGGRSAPGCANRPIVDFETDRSGSATTQCPNRIPKGLITNDMCLFYWTFTVQNADKITCTSCVMRWTWEGHHASPDSPEIYENCADVVVSTVGGDGGVATPTSTFTAPTGSPSSVVSSSVLSEPTATPSASSSVPPFTTTTTTRTTATASVTRSASPEPTDLDDDCEDGWDACNKGEPGTQVPFWACVDSKQSADFYACYPESPDREPVAMTCAPGTVCEQQGDWIGCVWP